MKLAVIHLHDTEGGEGCHGIAFYLTQPVQIGDIIGPQIIWPDWPEPRTAICDDGEGQTGDLIYCHACGGDILLTDLLEAKPFTIP